jgi:hypothetical protein
MARTCGHDSHAGGGILDYSIRGSPTPSISPCVLWLDWQSRVLSQNCEILNMAITYHSERAELHTMFSTSKQPNEQ